LQEKSLFEPPDLVTGGFQYYIIASASICKQMILFNFQS